jgi:hypothetical protein
VTVVYALANGLAVGGAVPALGRSPPSPDLLRQLDDDPRGATDVAEPVAVLVLLQLVDEFGAVSPQAVEDVVDALDSERDMTDARRVGRGARVTAVTRRRVVLAQLELSVAVRVRIIAMSDRTPSSPLMRSTVGLSSVASPSSSSPSSTKNAVAVARSSTTMPTWSSRWIVTRPG